jgi:hypothetical protein
MAVELIREEPTQTTIKLPPTNIPPKTIHHDPNLPPPFDPVKA